MTSKLQEKIEERIGELELELKGYSSSIVPTFVIKAHITKLKKLLEDG